VLLVYIVPRALAAGRLRYGATVLGDVRVTRQAGPTRPRSTCELQGAFGYAPIPRKLLLELRVRRALGGWTPLGTRVVGRLEGAESVTACAGFRRLDAHGRVLAIDAPPPEAPHPAEMRFLAVYDLPDGTRPERLEWEGTDCDASTVADRAPLPARLGPERGPPALQVEPPGE
jgi:hypothetical protein